MVGEERAALLSAVAIWNLCVCVLEFVKFRAISSFAGAAL